MPCIIPITLTYWGKSKKYFSGIATKSNNNSEIPSRVAVILKNLLINFLFAKLRNNIFFKNYLTFQDTKLL